MRLRLPPLVSVAGVSLASRLSSDFLTRGLRGVRGPDGLTAFAEVTVKCPAPFALASCRILTRRSDTARGVGRSPLSVAVSR